MSLNTHASDVNELWLTYELNGCRWYSLSDEDAFKEKSELIGSVLTQEQCMRASIMAGMFMGYADAVLKTSVHTAWWVSRPGMLTAVIGHPIDSKTNPSDVLVLLSNSAYLGVSCKSGKLQHAKLCFKNPGVGTLENALNCDMTSVVRSAEGMVQANYAAHWPSAYAARKRLIRSTLFEGPTTDCIPLGRFARKLGDSALTQIRDILYDKLVSLPVDEQVAHFEQYWLDSGIIYPRYIKLTGTGTGKNYTCSVEDPCDNPALDAIRAKNFYFAKGGDFGIVIKTIDTNHTLFRMRVKFKSEKLASTVAFTGEPGNLNTAAT